MILIFKLTVFFRFLVKYIFDNFSASVAKVIRFFLGNLVTYKILFVIGELITYVVKGGLFSKLYFISLFNTYSMVFLGAILFLIAFDNLVVKGDRRIFLYTILINIIFVIYDSNLLMYLVSSISSIFS